MSSRKILILAIVLPTLGMTVYSFKYSGQTCGGPKAAEKKYQCPRMYECVLESNEPYAMGVCRFMPNGLQLGRQKPVGNQVVETPPERDPTVEYGIQTKKAQRLAYTHTKLGFELLKILAYADQSNTKNIVISPTGLGLSLDSVFNGANGATKDQMANVLQLTGFSLFQLNETGKILLQRINVPAMGITSNLSNSLWVKKGVSLQDQFTKDAQSTYGVYVSELDLSQPESTQSINNWVNGNTAGKIPGIIPDKTDPSAASYSVSTAYFKGTGEYKFDTQKMEDRDFYKQNGERKPVKTLTMDRTDFLYLENKDFQGIKLPYGGDHKYSLIVLLPKTLGLDDLLEKFDMVNWQAWSQGFEKKDGRLYLPKFQIEYQNSLASPLKEVGLTLALDPTKADFSKLSADGLTKDFYLSHILHRTLVEFDETGEKTPDKIEPKKTVVNGVEQEIPYQPSFTMDVNRPFFFAIVNEETQSNMFVGIVREL